MWWWSGGSQAGLAMAWHLTRQGRRFVVLEAAPELGQTWRTWWDSLKLFTPAQYDALPGMAFPAPADTHPTKDPVADYLQAYATAFDLPVRLNAKATELRRLDDGSFEVRTADATFQGPAGGSGHWPVPGPLRPTAGSRPGPSVTQLHSADYRNPQAPRRGRCWWWGWQLGLPDRRGAGRHPHRRPVDRHQVPDAAPAAGGGTCSGG